jgi:lauroyl/myristoyl acyltransferase
MNNAAPAAAAAAAPRKRRRSFLSRHPRLKRIVYTGYGLLFAPLLLLSLPLALIPKRWLYAGGRRLALWCVYPAVRAHTLRNLTHAYDGRLSARRMDGIARAVAINVVWSALDCYYLWVWWWAWRRARIVVRTEGWPTITAALAAGRGVIVATMHYGCFEIMPVVFTSQGLITGGVIARKFPSPFLNWLNRRARLLHRLHTFYDQIKDVVRALRNNGIIGILPDLHARKRLAIPATFYSKPTLTFDIHARLAGQMQCPIVPAFLQRHVRRPWQYTLVLYPPITVPRKADDATIHACVQQLNDVFEWHLRRYPCGWIWFHNKWALW